MCRNLRARFERWSLGRRRTWVDLRRAGLNFACEGRHIGSQRFTFDKVFKVATRLFRMRIMQRTVTIFSHLEELSLPENMRLVGFERRQRVLPGAIAIQIDGDC